MPRILKRVLDARRGVWPSQPGLTPDAELGSGIIRKALPAPPDPEPPQLELVKDPAVCEHAFVAFKLPAEGNGRVYQCQKCQAIGFRRARFGGPGKIELYTCSKITQGRSCGGVAIRRMFGRGPRGAYIWACAEHLLQIEGSSGP